MPPGRCRLWNHGPSSSTRARRPSALLTVDQLEEPAGLSIGGFLLVEEYQVLFLELVEELVPGDLLQRGVVAESDPQHAGVVTVAGLLHARGPAVAGLHPLHDLVAVGRLSCLMRGCHRRSSLATGRAKNGAVRPGRNTAPVPPPGGRQCALPVPGV